MIPHASLMEAVVYDCTPWMFATAAAYRYGIALAATRQAAEWGVPQWHGADAGIVR